MELKGKEKAPFFEWGRFWLKYRKPAALQLHFLNLLDVEIEGDLVVDIDDLPAFLDLVEKDGTLDHRSILEDEAHFIRSCRLLETLK